MITRGLGTSALITRGYGGVIGVIVDTVIAEIVRLSSVIARVVGLESKV